MRKTKATVDRISLLMIIAALAAMMVISGCSSQPWPKQSQQQPQQPAPEITQPPAPQQPPAQQPAEQQAPVATPVIAGEDEIYSDNLDDAVEELSQVE